ncbi:sensory neuron membrane protein 1-like [Phymastichus coffea]|uniref:sensory neuron membrane protein 1-like n=1 Tax=Phymastichus coffea TaxID=108790 RepID=UPI00273B0C4B|nr:sensory neuron membrane protein 1-like [Phymastichus coffea]
MFLYKLKHDCMCQQVALKKGWRMRDLWTKLPFPLHFNFYFFNVTNPDEIDKGEKPILREVGPFSYDEWHEKTNLIDYETDDSVSYTLKNTYLLNLARSNGLTGDEEIVVVNYFMLIVINTLLIQKPSAIPFINKAMNSIFRKPNSMFIKAKVRDILFDGMMIDCNVSDTPGSALCKEINEKYEEFRLKKIGENLFSLSLWGSANSTDSKARIRVRRGLKSIMDLGRVIEYNDKPNMSVWNDNYCDSFNGTDGTIFHPYFDKKGKDDLVVFNADICRSISCRYDSIKVKHSGVTLLRYTGDLNVDGNDPREKCYCFGQEACSKKAPLNLYKCLGVPLFVTNPHFYHLDPYYSSMVDGLTPNKERHLITVDLDTFAGAPYQAYVRAQLNLFIQKVDKIKLMANFPEALLPLMWFERVFILPDYYIGKIKFGYRMLFLGRVFQYILMFIGLGLCIYASYKHYQLVKVADFSNHNNKRILIHRVAGAVGLILFVFGILCQFIILPINLKTRIKKEVALKEGWPMRKIWTKFPFSYETHFYVFNTTNYKEIEKGAKPTVKELGPYVYDVWQEKVNQKDYEEDDSLSYSLRRIHQFNRIKSHGLSDENDEVILPEYLRISAGSGFNRYNPAFVFAGSKAIDIIYNNPDSIFVKRPVKTFLFDGLAMPCKDITNYFGKVVCNQFYEFHLKYSLRDEDHTYYTSIWGHFNGTFERERKLRINRGSKNLKKIGEVIEYEEEQDFATWNNDSYCNVFHGTDGTVVRPFLNRKGKDDINIVNTVICRSLVYYYDSTVQYDGLSLLRYTTNFGTDVDNHPEEVCFCTQPESCIEKPGLLDLIRCTYVPWVGSHPHFYLADQSYVDAVDGVNPDKEKHMMFIDVDPLTGIIVRSHMRIQFNMELLSLKKFKLMKNFPTAMLPMVWVDEIIILPHFLIKKIKDRYNSLMLSQIIMYVIILSGFVICGVAGNYEYKFRRANKQNPVNVVPPPQSQERSSNTQKPMFAKAPTQSAAVPPDIN